MITLTTQDIINIVKAAIEIIIYIVIFFKLHSLKGSPLTVSDLLSKVKESIKTFLSSYTLADLKALLNKKDLANEEIKKDNEDEHNG